MTSLRIEAVSRNKRRRTAECVDLGALPLLPPEQRALLREWLKNDRKTRKWDSLLKIADQPRIEIAESLAFSLAANGLAILEERLVHSVWVPEALTWPDYEALCASFGMSTRAVKRNAFSDAWATAAELEWHSADLSEACNALRDAAPDKGLARLGLLCKLNEWLHLGRSGTRREFALFARDGTKQITRAEWAWLSEWADLAACGIEQHAPALWLAGDVQLAFGARTLDIGAVGDFIALKHSAVDRLTSGTTCASHYRLVENRTSFENLAHAAANSGEIIVWLPGYAPGWWCDSLGKLLAALPLPARISCDADPDGVQIALQAARLWIDRNLQWDAFAMSANDAANARHTRPMSEHDMRLAHTLLDLPALPPEMASLLHWCLDNRRKAEQENWL